MKYFLLSVFCILCSFVNAQKLIKDHVIKNQVVIRTIDPDSTDYSDLDAIGNAIGNAKVVMLGEQDHGDAPTFLAKTRLIKYLHEKKGFNVLAFESDFFALSDGWDKLQKSKSQTDGFLKQNIFPIWTVCSTCSPLFYNYVPATFDTADPITITGFDSQQYLSYSRKNLSHEIDSVLRNANAAVTKKSNYISQVLPLVDSGFQWPIKPVKDIVKVDSCLHYLQEMQSQLTRTLNKDNFWLMVIDNIVQQVRSVKTVLLTGKPQLASDDRDVQMAKNLKWLNEVKFKDQKIIVWAADYHVAKSLTNMTQDFFHKYASMGDRFITDLKNDDKVYVLGFSSYQGTAGRLGVKKYPLAVPRKNSFETWINQKSNFAFVDFDAFNLQYPNEAERFYSNALGHINHEGKWNNIFDGLFFIRDMYPCGNVHN